MEKTEKTIKTIKAEDKAFLREFENQEVKVKGKLTLLYNENSQFFYLQGSVNAPTLNREIKVTLPLKMKTK